MYFAIFNSLYKKSRMFVIVENLNKTAEPVRSMFNSVQVS